MAGSVGVLALQGAFREHMRALSDVGLEPVEVRQARDFAGLEGLVIPGGESTTMSKLMVAYGLEQPIRDLRAAGAPVFGTCAGMILVARHAVDVLPDQRSLGLIDIEVRRNAKRPGSLPHPSRRYARDDAAAKRVASPMLATCLRRGGR